VNYHSIDSILLKRPYLELIQEDLYDISSRIKEIESGYFIVRNLRSDKFEVHSTMNGGWDTYCFTVPYDELDVRTLQYCRETNIATRGDSIEKELDRNNAKIDETRERDFKRTMNDAGLETAEMVAFGIDEDELHEGYSKVHYMGGGALNNES